MTLGEVDVIIPAYRRPEAIVSVITLLALGQTVRRIFIIDSGNGGIDGQLVARLAGDERVSVMCCSRSPFCKSAALNLGLRACTSRNVLVSDAEIVWRMDTFQAMQAVVVNDNAFCFVRDVEETAGRSSATVRPRVGYRIDSTKSPPAVFIERRLTAEQTRPGCGLVLASQEAWRNVGGYCEDLVGWGWEDQDLLMRAELLGGAVASAGHVLHVTHSDGRRNTDLPGLTPVLSRNNNIRRAISRISAGRLSGDLMPDRQELACVPPRFLFDPDIEDELIGGKQHVPVCP